MKTNLIINSGIFKGKKIFFKHSNETRPTKNNVKINLFSYFNKKIEKNYILDLFSGSGVINFEFISRGSLKNLALELNNENYKNIIKNKNRICKKNNLFNIILTDSYKWLKKNNIINTTIIIYDPPYTYHSSSYFLIINKIFLLRKCLSIFIECNNNIINKIINNWFLIKKNKIGKTKIYIFKVI